MTAIEQAAINRDIDDYFSALDAFAKANGFLDPNSGEEPVGGEVLIDTVSLINAFETQGVLPFGEEAAGEGEANENTHEAEMTW